MVRFCSLNIRAPRACGGLRTKRCRACLNFNRIDPRLRRCRSWKRNTERSSHHVLQILLHHAFCPFVLKSLRRQIALLVHLNDQRTKCLHKMKVYRPLLQCGLPRDSPPHFGLSAHAFIHCLQLLPISLGLLQDPFPFFLSFHCTAIVSTAASPLQLPLFSDFHTPTPLVGSDIASLATIMPASAQISLSLYMEKVFRVSLHSGF